MNITKSKLVDKFYTKPEVATQCWEAFRSCIDNDIDDLLVIEPSAGDGKLLDVVQCDKIGFDLYPDRDDIIQNDFILGDITPHISSDKIPIIFGNPPFGSRSKLAIKFLNRSFDYSNMVGFILPVQFKKYLTQNKINSMAKLIFEMDLPHDAFTLNGVDYKVRSVFQVWSTSLYETVDLRVDKPKTTHNDFDLYQYNATKQALKFFDSDWDFAVLRQGYGDFNEIHYKNDVGDLSKKKQWMFIKPKSNEVKNRLLSIDFEKLAELNTSTKGFGKGDLIKLYIDTFGD